MQEQRWKILNAVHSTKLSYRGGCIVSTDEKGIKTDIPMAQISTLLVQSSQCVITVPLLIAMEQQGVRMIVCDRTHSPALEMHSCFHHHAEAAGHIIDQCAWTQERKDSIWADIVANKIENQAAVLQMSEGSGSLLWKLVRFVIPGDKANREGQAARNYFSALFGPEFTRHSEDNINAALNYGYAILRAHINCKLAADGFHPALGIHHHSRRNPYNLSCDLMEPFRPFVDHLVYQNRESSLDADYRNKLIQILQTPVKLGSQTMELSRAADEYIKDVVHAMKDSCSTVRRAGFA